MAHEISLLDRIVTQTGTARACKHTADTNNATLLLSAIANTR